jgi:acetyltransferase-like isoleucine patch superfamily enzyme
MKDVADVIKLGFLEKIYVRLYIVFMRFEGMWALSIRRRLIAAITGKRVDHLNIFANVFIEGFEGLVVGEHVSINRDSNLSCVGGVTIGDHVAIGHGTSIISNQSRHRRPRDTHKISISFESPGADWSECLDWCAGYDLGWREHCRRHRNCCRCCCI